MKAGSTVIGLLVVGLVATGMYYAKTRSRDEAMPAHGSGHTMTLPGAASSSPALPDITTADATETVGGVAVTLSVSPRPPIAFATKHFRVRVGSQGVPATLDEGRIVFEMDMPMGEHRYSLVASQDGWYTADVVLPFCASGNPRWYATVTGTVAGTPVTAKFRVDLTKP